MYIRFVTGETDRRSLQRAGVFACAYELTDSEVLEPFEKDLLDVTLGWFEGNLPVPSRSRLVPRAIFWFKEQAGACASRVWDLAGVLARQSRAVELLKTSRPGYVVYEDEFQVAAIPFRDTFMDAGR